MMLANIGVFGQLNFEKNMEKIKNLTGKFVLISRPEIDAFLELHEVKTDQGVGNNTFQSMNDKCYWISQIVGVFDDQHDTKLMQIMALNQKYVDELNRANAKRLRMKNAILSLLQDFGDE